MSLDGKVVGRDVGENRGNSLGPVGAWLDIWSKGIQQALDLQVSIQKDGFEKGKTLAWQTTRTMQDVVRFQCGLLSYSPIPEVVHAAKITQSYTFNTHKKDFEIPIAKSVERTNIHELADLIHVVPEDINPDIRPKLVIPAASSHDEMLAQDTSAAMTRYGAEHHVLARKSGEELQAGIDTTMNAEIGMIVDVLKRMHEQYPDGFDLIAICEGSQVSLIAAMVCLEEYGFAPANIVSIAAAMFPDSEPSEVSKAARNASKEDIDAVAVTLPSGVRVIPAELNILNFLGKKLGANTKRAFELYLDGPNDEDLTRKGIHQNELMMNGRSFTADNFLGTHEQKGKMERYFVDPELQQGYGIYNEKKYYIADYNFGRYIPLGGKKDDIAPIGQGTAILESFPESVRGTPVEVDGGHYSAFTGKEWREKGFPGIVMQTDGVILNPDIFIGDVLRAA